MSKVVKPAGASASESRNLKMHGLACERGAMKRTKHEVNDEKPRGFLNGGKNNGPSNRKK